MATNEMTLLTVSTVTMLYYLLVLVAYRVRLWAQ